MKSESEFTLNDTERELLIAAVDGELSTSAQQAFEQLGAQNPRAHEQFRKLANHRDRLAAARRHSAPAGLVNDVLARLQALPRYELARPRQRLGRLPMAIAASLLLAVGSVAFLAGLNDAQEQVENRTRERLPKNFGPEKILAAINPARTNVVETVSSPRVASADNNSTEVVSNPALPETAPLPRLPGTSNVFGSATGPDQVNLTAIQIRLSFLAPVGDLDREDLKPRILDELARDPAYRIDLFAKDTVRAAELFQNAAKTSGLNLMVEAATLDRLKKKQPGVWVVYTEALTAEELAKLLAAVATASRIGEPCFTTVHMIPAQTAERNDLRDLLGVDPGLWKRAKPTAPAAKSIATGTLDQVAASLKKDKPALFTTAQPANARVSPAASRDVKAFLDSRGERKPNVVPAVIYIRPAN